MSDEAGASPAPGGFNTNKLFRYGVICTIIFFALFFFLRELRVRPPKPVFTLQDITVSAFNVSTTQPYYLSTTLQVTISSRNVMSHAAIIYKELSLYATYRNEQITLRYSLPVTYQEHSEVVVWSPYLQGYVETISPISGPVLMQDLNTGRVLVLIKVDGRMKYRFGGLTSVTYKLYGHCPAIIDMGDMDTKKDFAVAASDFKFQLVQNCRVEITTPTYLVVLLAFGIIGTVLLITYFLRARYGVRS